MSKEVGIFISANSSSIEKGCRALEYTGRSCFNCFEEFKD